MLPTQISTACLTQLQMRVRHLGPVAQADDKQEPEARSGPSGEDASKGLSAFLGGVLDQLSVTSWLPSVFLVGNAAVLLAMQGQKALDVPAALKGLAELEWGAIVVLTLSVTIGAIVIQAFEFEGLRFWEGYARAPYLTKWSSMRIEHFSKRRTALETDCRVLARATFDDARRTALDTPTTTDEQIATLNALEKLFHDRKLDSADKKSLAGARALRWPRFASPARLHEWDVAKLKLAEFPEAHRILPTRLGNVMRSAEDQVRLQPDEDLEGFMIRNADLLPPTILTEHSAYRRRLEMYCGLMFVLWGLALLSLATLWQFADATVWRVGVPAAYVAGTWVAYVAAIASARGFGQAIKEASAWIQRDSVSQPVT